MTIPASSTSTQGHPLDPLSRTEILQTVAAVRAHVAKGGYAGRKVENVLFNSIDLRPPNKYAVLKWANLFPESELEGVSGEHGELKREAEVSYRLVTVHLSTRTDSPGPPDLPQDLSKLRGDRLVASKLEGHRRSR